MVRFFIAVFAVLGMASLLFGCAYKGQLKLEPFYGKGFKAAINTELFWTDPPEEEL